MTNLALLDNAFIENLLENYLNGKNKANLGSFVILIDEYREQISIYNMKRKNFEKCLTRIRLDEPNGKPVQRLRKDDAGAEDDLAEFVNLINQE